MNEAENAACATVYWFVGLLCPNTLPVDKTELAAETVIRYCAAYKSRDEALSYIQTYRLCESEFWKSL